MNIINFLKKIIEAINQNLSFEDIKNIIQNWKTLIDIDLNEKLPSGLTDSLGFTLLHKASNTSNIEIHTYKLFLENFGEDIKLQATDKKYTALHLAVQSNNIEIVQELLDKNIPGFVGKQDVYGQTALHWAAGKGFEEIAKKLIDKMDDNEISIQKEENKYTALHLAVQSNNIEIVQELLDKNIPGFVGKQDVYGQTALHWAAGKGFEEIAKKLIDKMDDNEISIQKEENKYTALHLAVQSNNIEIVQELLDKNIPGFVGKQDVYGQTALHWAAGKGYNEIVDLLLDEMSDDAIKLQATDRKCTALDFATQGHHTEVINLLLNEKPSLVNDLINKVDIYDRNPLYYACLKRYTDICEIILDKIDKNDLMKQDRNGNTALHAICNSFSSCDESSVKSIIEKIITKNPSIINIASKFDQTPLHYSTLKAEIEICKTLLVYMSKELIMKKRC